MDLFEIPDAVQRDIVDSIMLLVESKKKPTIIVFFEIVWMDGPVVGYIRESPVLNMQDGFIDNSIEEFLKPVKAGIRLDFVIAYNALGKATEVQFIL